jgi:sec-independent protein translocase protein TatB
MFNIDWGELFVILVVALVVVGPKDLPRMMRKVGQWAGRARAMADQFRRSFDDIARQTELDELRAEVNRLQQTAIIDPKAEIESAMYPTENPINFGNDDVSPPTPPSAPAPSVEPPNPQPEPVEGHPELVEGRPEPVEGPATQALPETAEAPARS